MSALILVAVGLLAAAGAAATFRRRDLAGSGECSIPDSRALGERGGQAPPDGTTLPLVDDRDGQLGAARSSTERT